MAFRKPYGFTASHDVFAQGQNCADPVSRGGQHRITHTSAACRVWRSADEIRGGRKGKQRKRGSNTSNGRTVTEPTSQRLGDMLGRYGEISDSDIENSEISWSDCLAEKKTEMATLATLT